MTDILLNILHEAQEKHGYLSEEVLKELSITHQVPISKLYGLATFHTMLYTKEVGKNIIELCGSPSCTLNKAREIEDFLEKELNIKTGNTTEDKKFSLFKTSCIGCCDEAPAMLVNGIPHGNLTVERAREIIKELKNADS